MFTAIRYFLALALALTPVETTRAACVFDAQQGIGTTYSPSVTSRTFLLNTSLSNDRIIIFFALNALTGTTYPFPSVTSVSGGGLSWSLRGTRIQQAVPGCYISGTCYIDSEEWTAFASSPISSATITVNVGSDLGYANFNVMAIHGASGFDTNPALPASNQNLSGSASAVQVTGVSTLQSPDMAIFVCNVYTYTAGLDCGYNSTQAPWNTIVGNWQGNIFSGFGVETQSFQRVLVAPVSGVTFQPFSATNTIRWLAVADALVCPSGTSNVNVQIIE